MKHFLFALLLAVPALPQPTSDDVFTSGQDGYHTYRIPRRDA